MTTLGADEASVAARSAGLKRELGLTDLVLTQILFIVSLPWVGVAAKRGPAHVVFWLVALALFYVRVGVRVGPGVGVQFLRGNGSHRAFSTTVNSPSVGKICGQKTPDH
jgi:hypothetical protein